MLVEDEDAVRAVACRALLAAGYEVVAAGHAAEALRCAELGEFDVLVTDVVMPGMSGPKLAETLRAHRPGLGVLLVSGYPGETLDLHSAGQPELAFLSKPYTGSQLVAAVSEVRRERARSRL